MWSNADDLRLSVAMGLRKGLGESGAVPNVFSEASGRSKGFPQLSCQSAGNIPALKLLLGGERDSGGQMFRRENVPLVIMTLVSLAILLVFVASSFAMASLPAAT